MLKHILSCILILLLINLNAQIVDVFADGDLTQNPTWHGDTNYFQVSNQMLQSNGPASNGSSVADTLAITLDVNESLYAFEWKFLIDLKFNPTSSNFVRIYLCSDSQDLKKATDSYYIEIGRTTSDSIKFFKEISGVKELLFVGKSSFSSNVKVSLLIQRDSNGVWNLFSDLSGGNNYSSEGASFTDQSITYLNYFGVYCQYKTDSRSDKYYFDDFFLGAIIPDLLSPTIKEVNILNPSSIDVLFSEPIDSLSATAVGNYQIDQGIGSPALAILDAFNPSLVHLILGSNLIIDQIYQLSIESIYDLSSNILSDTVLNVFFHETGEHDVLISEIITDETPQPNYLPEKDFVELYNRSNYPVQLKDWTIVLNGNNSRLFDQDFLLDTSSFVILCHDDDIGLFSNYGDVIGFSSFTINNEGSVCLRNEKSQVIHFIDFDKLWYNDDLKSDGGWSIEMIDVENPCGGFENWKASIDNKGGSPGELNSVAASNPDLIIPEIDRIDVHDPLHISVLFSETIDSLQLKNFQNYQIDGGIGYPIIGNALAPEYRQIDLVLGQALSQDSVYSLILQSDVNDCSGNLSDCCVEQKFGLPSVADTNDLIINEVLFNPLSSGVDYVEIVNRSDKIIDISKYYLASIDAVLGSVDQVSEILDHQYQLFPGAYLLLTTDIEKVSKQYITKDRDVLINVQSLPSLSNDKGSILIVNQSLTTIDRFDYDEDMHFALLNTVEGVSLERLDFNRPTQNIDNWHSAAESAGFGTPGYFNSQSLIHNLPQGQLDVFPEVFSPDNDGFDDVVSFNYQFEDHGLVMSARIFDSKGRLVKTLVNNEQIAPSGSISWDGIDEYELKANIGIYLLVLDVFDLQGNKMVYKKSFVLSSKL